MLKKLAEKEVLGGLVEKALDKKKVKAQAQHGHEKK